MKNIIFIGMTGVGKTTIASCLADKLNMDVKDIDQLIEEKLSMTIDEIFSTKGEAFFRDAESSYLLELVGKENLIISTGAGIVLDRKNRYILSSSNTIYLKGKLDTIYDNIINDRVNCRPLLKKGNVMSKLEDMYKIREKYYIECAKSTIIVDDKDIDIVLNEIINTIENVSCS